MQKKKINHIKFLSIKILGFICLSSFINAQAQQIIEEKSNPIETSYLDSKNEFQDYILDTGDSISIDFDNAPELSSIYTIDEQGEIYAPRIKYTYIRGLTINELTGLLEKRYKEFLLNPEIYIRIVGFKPIRVDVKGEVRSPRQIKFSAFAAPIIRSNLKLDLDKTINSDNRESQIPNENVNLNLDYPSTSINKVKRDNEYITTLSNAIKGAGGLTPYSDISNIEIIRDIPIGKGGGKKMAKIDLLSYINASNPINDIRLFDGDVIFIPSLKEKDSSIVPRSVLAGLSPKFISVEIKGRIENPGEVKIPYESSLSDVMNLSGPRTPLSGKVFLLRYNNDGTLLRKNIKYSATSAPGSQNNPFLIAGDSITVQNSILGRTSGVLAAVTEPFWRIYLTREMYETIRGNN